MATGSNRRCCDLAVRGLLLFVLRRGGLCFRRGVTICCCVVHAFRVCQSYHPAAKVVLAFVLP